MALGQASKTALGGGTGLAGGSYPMHATNQINTGVTSWPVEPERVLVERLRTRDAQAMMEELLAAMFDGDDDDRLLVRLVAIRERLTLEHESVQALLALYDRLAERLGSI